MKDNSITSRTIEWLRFPCIVAVVLIHLNGSPFGDADYFTFHNGICDTLKIIVSEGICRLAVPIFFFIAGYLFFVGLEKWDKSVWTGKLKRRVRTLLVPYLLWNLIVILFIPLKVLIIGHFSGMDPSNVQAFGGFRDYLRAFWDWHEGMPYNFPLWFIRDLIVIVLLTPAIHLLVKKTGIYGVGILYILYAAQIARSFPGFSIEGLFYFTFGAYFSITGLDFSRIFTRKLRVTTAISLSLLIALTLLCGNSPAYEYSKRLFTLFGSVAAIGLVSEYIGKGKLTVHPALSDSAFFIFATHGKIIDPIVSYPLRPLFSRTQIGEITYYFLTVFLVILVSVLLYHLMKKIMPKTTALLTGGR